MFLGSHGKLQTKCFLLQQVAIRQLTDVQESSTVLTWLRPARLVHHHLAILYGRIYHVRQEANMRKKTIVMFCLVLISCTRISLAGPDAISNLVARLNADMLWINGIYPIINLPPDAKPESILAEAIKMTGFDQGHIKKYKILEIRQVQLNDGQMQPYSAALVESDLGLKVFLFKSERDNQWWTRFYDVPKEKPNKASDATSEPAPGAASSSPQR